MGFTLLGRKIGMTRVFNDDGVSVPVTAIEVGPCVVTQLRTPECDGYAAVQIGFDDIKPRNASRPIIGHDAKAGAAPKRRHAEFRVTEKQLDEYTLGQELTVATLEGIAFVDVSATSKGKGFQGVMKRHNFSGQEASHGVERKHRSAGSIGGHATNRGTGPKPKKGKRMAGQMGNKRRTVQNLRIVDVRADDNLVLVRGGVPGPRGGSILIRKAVKG
jgi:large subunit ribosomal protein L3